jgi:hypothetical protein
VAYLRTLLTEILCNVGWYNVQWIINWKGSARRDRAFVWGTNPEPVSCNSQNKIRKALNQYSRCCGRNSNRSPPAYKSQVPQLKPPSQRFITFISEFGFPYFPLPVRSISDLHNLYVISFNILPTFGSRDIPVGVLTRIRTGRPTNRSSTAERVRKFFFL